MVNINPDEVPLHVYTPTVVASSQAMMQQLTREQEEKMNHIQALARCYQNSVETNKKLVEQAALSIEEEDLVAFIQVSRCFWSSSPEFIL